MLVVAGDVSPDDIKQRVEKYFGDIPPGPPVAHFKSWVAKREGSQRQEAYDLVPQPRIFKVWNIPPSTTRDGALLDMLSDVLVSDKASRLYKRLVYDEQTASAVSAYIDSREIGSLFFIDVTGKGGGQVDAALARRGLKRRIALRMPYVVLSPLIGMSLGFILMVSVYWIFRKVSVNKIDKGFRIGQLFSAAAFSLGHGGNDAQKTMGIITIALVAGGFLQMTPAGKLPDVPLWVVLAAHTAIGLGTLSGGWRIVKTMGTKIVKLQPVGGFCAETAGAATLFFATFTGIPVSTTHTITGSIVGVGSAKRFSAVKWGVAGRIVWAWVLTIPAAGFIAALTYGVVLIIEKLTGQI